MRRRNVPFAASAALVLLAALAAVAQERRAPQLSVVSASYRSGVLTIVIRNEGENAGGGTVTVHREQMRCLEEDAEYCKEHPSDGCVAPCKKFETKDLGEETATVPTIASFKEGTVEVRIPDEEAYAEVTVDPGSGLGFGIEIKPRA